MSLRQQVLRGGAYLMGRQVLGLVIKLGGVVLLTRMIGPASYGLYAGAAVIVLFLAQIGRMGVDVHLIRRQENVEDSVYNQAFTLNLTLGVGLTAACLAALPFLDGRLLDSRFVEPLGVLLGTLPLFLLPVVPMAKLERDLNYRSVAMIELVGQTAYYVVALGLAAAGWGVWAPVIGHWAWQSLTVVQSYAITRFRPRLVWSRGAIAEMLRYGLGYSSASWVYQLRPLVNPIVVGRYLGPEAVGYIALAVRIAEVLGVAKQVTWRLSIAAFAKIQGDLNKLARSMEEAMSLQLLSIGPLLAGFAALAAGVLPWAFGSEWGPVLRVFPYIALGLLVNSVFSMHSSVLYVLRRNVSVALFSTVHVLLFALGSAFLVPRVGLIGYGLAEVVALSSYAVIHLQVRRLFDFTYARAVPWLIGFTIPLFGVFLPFPLGLLLWLPVFALALMPRQRRQLHEYLRYVRPKIAEFGPLLKILRRDKRTHRDPEPALGGDVR